MCSRFFTDCGLVDASAYTLCRRGVQAQGAVWFTEGVPSIDSVSALRMRAGGLQAAVQLSGIHVGATYASTCEPHAVELKNSVAHMLRHIHSIVVWRSHHLI